MTVNLLAPADFAWAFLQMAVANGGPHLDLRGVFLWVLGSVAAVLFIEIHAAAPVAVLLATLVHVGCRHGVTTGNRTESSPAGALGFREDGKKSLAAFLANALNSLDSVGLLLSDRNPQLHKCS
jgi:hypothetical protein